MSEKKIISEREIKKKLQPVESECVVVCIRCRPLIHKKELETKKICVKINEEDSRISIVNPEKLDQSHNFTFDGVFPPGSTQQKVYNSTASKVVDSVLQGYNGTVIAYGQTGAGKTFTMEGNEKMPGLIPQTFSHIFDAVKRESKERKYLISCAMIQVYKEEVFDLLGKNTKQKLKLRENVKTKEFYVHGMSSYMVNSAKQIEKIMKKGQKNRVSHATPMNPGSSRSHSIFQVRIEQIEKYKDGKEHVKSGKLQLVDLAGSERAKKTGGVRQDEMIKINWGLSCLGNVIMSLTAGKKGVHIPYRDSRLTKLLMDSLGGNTKTVMIANISPSSYNYNETLGTLRYASRAKKIQNKPVINEDPKDALIRQFQQQIEKLKSQLSKGGPSIFRGGVVDDKLLMEMKKKNEEEKKALMREMSKKTEDEKKALLQRQNDIESKRKEIELKLKDRATELERQRKDHAMMKQKLKKFQAQIVEGGQLKKINEAFKKKILENRMEIEKRKVKEINLKRQLQEKMDAEKMLKKEFTSTQDEVKIKTRKLKKLWEKLKQVQNENDDLVSLFQAEREEYLFAIKNLEKEIKKKTLIITNFIPFEEVNKVQKRLEWNPQEEEFKLTKFQLSGSCVRKRHSAHNYDRPRVIDEEMSVDPRYKSRNILDFEDEKLLNFVHDTGIHNEEDDDEGEGEELLDGDEEDMEFYE